MDFKVNISVCRICMKTETGQNSLDNPDLKEKYMFTTHLKIEEYDNMPKIICERCESRLIFAHDFVRMAHSTEKSLKAFLAKMSSDFEAVAKGTNDFLNLKENSTMAFLEDIQQFEEELSQEDKQFIIIVDEPESKKEKSYNKLPITKDSVVDKTVKDENCNSGNDDLEELYYLDDDLIDEKESMNSNDETSHEQNMTEVFDDNSFQVESEACHDALADAEDSQDSVVPPDGSDGYLKEYDSFLEHNNEHSTEYGDSNSMGPIQLYETDLLKNQEVEMSKQIVNTTEGIMILGSNMDSQGDTNSDNVKLGTRKINRKAKKTSPVNTRFFCIKCNRDFSSKTNLTRHKATHEGNKPFKCQICGKGFSQNGSLKQHMFIHTGERPYVCEVCQRGFTQCKSLVFHMRRHTGEKPFPCDHCGMFFRQKDGLKAHILKHHLIVEYNGRCKTHVCAICKLVLNTKQALKEHMKQHVNNHKPPASMSTNTLEQDRNILMELIEEDEILPDKPIKMEEDLSINLDNINNSTHVVDVMTSTAVPSRAKKFQCRKCFKCFAIKKNLIRHLIVHDVTASELYQCKTCQIGFDTNFALKQHRLMEHKESDQNFNECDGCHCTFENEDEYKQHLCDNQDFSCPECPYLNFKSHKLMLEHLLEHELNDGIS